MDQSRRSLRAFAACAFVGLAGALAWLTPGGPALEAALGLPALFHLRGVEPVTEPVVIVAVNRGAAERLWLPRAPRREAPCADVRTATRSPGAAWMNPPPPTRLSSWPRCLHGMLVERLRRAGAKVVVFDMLFRPREQAFYGFDVAADDARFADAMRAAGNVIIGHKLEQDTDTGAEGGASLAPLSSEIHAAALAAAPFPLPEPRDHVRRVALFFDSNPPLPTLPAIAFHAFARDSERASGLDAGGDDPRDAALLVRTAFLRERFATRAQPSARNRAGDALSAALFDLFSGPALRYLDFHGPPGTVPTLGYDAIIAGDPAASALVHGRAVFVGYSEPAQAEPHDDHRTVFTGKGGNMHGVEIAATTFANIHGRTFIRPTRPFEGAGIVFVAGVVATALVLRAPVTLGLGAVLVMGAGYLAAALFAFRTHHAWLPLIWPLAVQLPAGALVALIMRYREAILQRARLQRAVAKFLPADVTTRLTQNAQALHTLRRQVQAACMATDAHRYTALAERLAPEALLEFLNRYYEPMFDAVAKHGGFVSDVVGDSMVAIWPEGPDSIDTRTRVCLACLSLIEGADRLAAREPEIALITRVGVAWGPIVLAPVGALNHYEYRGVGDPVNTGNRLQTLAKRLGVRVAVSAELTNGLDQVLTRDLGDYLLRGKSDVVRVVEIVARTGDADARVRARCKAFDHAVTAWRTGDIALARTCLEQLKLSQPDDAPTQFLLDRLHDGTLRASCAIPME
ncbi:MAG: CHASE2 domain-containing protein [Betaproteobacteria bacterium]